MIPLAALILAACGGKTGTESAGQAAASTPTAEADALWEQRVDEEKLKAAIAAYEAVLATTPNDRHALERATRGWYFWGDAFTTDKEVQIERWAKALEYGNRCLALNAKYAEILAGGGKERDAAVHFLPEDVGCVYWTATALGKWGKASGISKTLKHLPTVKAYISKVEELDPTYFHYGPARYWGAYYSALPSFAGQDFEKSESYFEAAIQGAPYYLPTRVLRAEMLAVGTQDVNLFDKELLTVLRADPNAKPEAGITPENTRDQDKARALFARRDELFDKKVLEAAGPAPAIPAKGEAPAVAPESAMGPAPVEPPAEPAPAPAAPEPAPAPADPAPAPAAPAPAPAAPAPAAPAPAPQAPAPK